MNWVEFNSEVFYSSDDIIKVDRAGISQLQQKAQQGPRNRSRLCSHRGVDDPLHEMLIVHEKGIYVRPHKHVGKSESFHVIEGDVDIVLFDDAGGVLDVIEMGDYASSKVFYYRLADAVFHTVIMKSNAVFHEVTNGPFRREDTIFAEWSPGEEDPQAVREFLQSLNSAIAKLERINCGN
jgi:cupin fold WbuC family metalloprotein